MFVWISPEAVIDGFMLSKPNRSFKCGMNIYFKFNQIKLQSILYIFCLEFVYKQAIIRLFCNQILTMVCHCFWHLNEKPVGEKNNSVRMRICTFQMMPHSTQHLDAEKMLYFIYGIMKIYGCNKQMNTAETKYVNMVPLIFHKKTN